MFSREGNAPIKTVDIDIVVPGKLQISGGKTVDAVLAALGFSPVAISPESPLMTAYEGEIDGIELQLEFLTHLPGPQEDIAIEVQSGLSAQALRYTSILHDNQVNIPIYDFLVDGELVDLRVNVPTPPAFVYNKGLIFPRRNNIRKKTKDLYYIFDILSFDYPNSLANIAPEIIKLASNYPSKWFKTFKDNLSGYFISNTHGLDLVLSQKPSWAYTSMNDEQFKVFVETLSNDFIRKLNSA